MALGETFSTMKAAFMSWFRQNTTADAIKDGAKTFFWVALLTILIWIFAEQRQRVREQDIPVRIALHTADADRIVSFVRQHDEVPIITLEGPKQTIDDVKRQLAGDKAVINIDVPTDMRPGVRDINIAPTIRDASIFIKNGISVLDVAPNNIEIRIEPLKTYELEVTAPATANLDGAATFEPKTIKVRAPENVFNEYANSVGGKDKVVAVAEIPATGQGAIPGPHDLKLPVTLPAPFEGDNVTLLSNPNVEANYTVKQSNVSVDIPSLLIYTTFVGTQSNDLVVELARSTIPITITGPLEKCKKVKQNADTNQPVPYAMVQISASDVQDLRNGSRDFLTLSKRLTYQLGDPDVSVIPSDQTKTVDVTIRKRAQ